MNKELFGVFGDTEAFERFRDRSAFDAVVEGDGLTVGVRDLGLNVPNRSATYEDENGACVVWGEAYPPSIAANTASWLLERYREAGNAALSSLNGSYLAAVETDGEAIVATDPVRSWECYYGDAAGVRVFGTDPAAVARTIPSPTLRRQQLLEFAHLGVVLGDRTVFDELRRVPFDGRLLADSTEAFERFAYRPREFDYVGELAERLDRAIRRRTTHPGSKGLMLSAGFDSRTILARHGDLDACYTIGRSDSAETAVASRLAEQHDTPHSALVSDGRHLNTDWETIRYGHGIKESLHVHHARYVDQIDVDTIYHGLLFDTFLRGHFLPKDGYELFGRRLPRGRLEPDPDPIGALLARKFGVIPQGGEFREGPTASASGTMQFVRDALERELSGLDDRVDSPHNAAALLGIQNQPTTTFRTHLADHYLESFVAADAELLEWHLATPPEHRNTRTLLRAIERLDDDVLQFRPPDRPYDSQVLNAVEQFVRGTVPFLKPFEKSWPDRRDYYERENLDQRLFSTHEEVHDLPVRLKLRLNDITCWVNNTLDAPVLGPIAVLDPPADRFSADEMRPGYE